MREFGDRRHFSLYFSRLNRKTNMRYFDQNEKIDFKFLALLAHRRECLNDIDALLRNTFKINNQNPHFIELTKFTSLNSFKLSMSWNPEKFSLKPDFISWKIDFNPLLSLLMHDWQYHSHPLHIRIATYLNSPNK